MRLSNASMAALSRAHSLAMAQIRNSRKPDHVALWREFDKEIMAEIRKRGQEIREQNPVLEG